MENNVLVIGNGYDLAHGLRTRYEDFIDWIRGLNVDYWNTVVQEDDKLYDRVWTNGFVHYLLEYKRTVVGWVDVEHLIKKVISDFETFFINELEFVDGRGQIEVNVLPVSQDIDKKRVLNAIFKFPVCGVKERMGITMVYEMQERYYSTNYGINKKEIIKLLRDQLDELIWLLQIYLKVHIAGLKESLIVKKQIEEIRPDYLISFNYTDTWKIYKIRENNVFYVHGSIEKGNVVLGYNDDEDNWDFAYFKKYFQRIQKLTEYFDKQKMIKTTGMEIIHPLIHFYGHSMDNSDGDLIRELRSVAIGFRIYRYNQEDYEQKVINLFDVFGKEDTIQMIQSGYIKFIDCE